MTTEILITQSKNYLTKKCFLKMPCYRIQGNKTMYVKELITNNALFFSITEQCYTAKINYKCDSYVIDRA